MQVTAINPTISGFKRPLQQDYLRNGSSDSAAFEDFLNAALAPRRQEIPEAETPDISEEVIRQAIKRAYERIETLLGEEVAESVVNEDGSIDIVRLAQVMNAAERPYANSNRVTLVNAPQVLSLIA